MPPLSIDMDNIYIDFIEGLKNRIASERIKVTLSANSSMICLYWDIGKAILNKQKKLGWGAKVIDRISFDLKDRFPDMSGFSPRNIKYMRKFAEIWQDFEIVQQVVAQIPWRANITLDGYFIDDNFAYFSKDYESYMKVVLKDYDVILNELKELNITSKQGIAKAMAQKCNDEIPFIEEIIDKLV